MKFSRNAAIPARPAQSADVSLASSWAACQYQNVKISSIALSLQTAPQPIINKLHYCFKSLGFKESFGQIMYIHYYFSPKGSKMGKFWSNN